MDFIGIAVALTTGALVALFLWSLEKCTDLRWQYPWLLYALPLAGVGIWYLYKLAGKNAAAGNNLIMDNIHEPGGGVPAPYGPAGINNHADHAFVWRVCRPRRYGRTDRGSMAQLYARWFRLTVEDVQVLLTAGMALVLVPCLAHRLPGRSLPSRYWPSVWCATKH